MANMRYSEIKKIEILIKELIKDLRTGLPDAEAPELCKRLDEIGIMGVRDDSLRGAMVGLINYLQRDRQVRNLTAVYAERFVVYDPTRGHLIGVLNLALNYIQTKLAEVKNAK